MKQEYTEKMNAYQGNEYEKFSSCAVGFLPMQQIFLEYL